MENSYKKALQGYHAFREKYVHGDTTVLKSLHEQGQKPEIMVVACCDSRVDPALIMQCDPGDLFVVRNVANIVPPYEKDEKHHGTSAALEFGICYLKVKHLILLGHSQCGGINALLKSNTSQALNDDFITNWVSVIKDDSNGKQDVDSCAKYALNQSHDNCLGFPWIKDKVDQGQLLIHLWYFDIKSGQIFSYYADSKQYLPLRT